jgi:hypothetical protein
MAIQHPILNPVFESPASRDHYIKKKYLFVVQNGPAYKPFEN